MTRKLTGLLLMLVLAGPPFAGPASALAAAAPAQAEATVLSAIEIVRTAAETKVFLRGDGTIKDYREVRLKKNIDGGRPERMYLDLKHLRAKGLSPVTEVGTALARVRSGRRSDGVRVVFDSGLAELFGYELSAQPDGLLVTIREPSRPAADPAAIGPEAASEVAPAAGPAAGLVTIYPEPRGAGDLDLLIVPSEAPEQIQEWLAGSPAGRSGLQMLQTAKENQEVNTSFLVTGVTPDSNGDYAVAVSFTLLDPAGKPLYNKRSFARTSGRAPTDPAFLLVKPVLGLILGESDPAGEYIIIGRVEDLTSNKMFRTSRKLIFAKGQE